MLNTHFARRWRFVLPLSLILLTAPLASGAIVLESKGWRVTLPTWVARAGGVVVEDPAPDDVLLIQIVKIFRGDAGGVGDMPSVVASFTQIAGAEALTGPQDAAQAMVAEFKVRRDLLVDGLNAIDGITCKRPRGAFYVFPNISSLGLTSKQVEQKLLDDFNVAALAGTSFGKYGEGYLRFSYANSQENIRKALERFADFVAAARS